MGVDHVEVPLVDRQVHRLAHRPAAVVEVRAQVGELHEVAEVLDRPVAAAAVQVAHERRAVGRREDRGVAADPHAALRVAGVLDELVRGARLDDLPAHPAREPDALALDVRAGVAEQLERVGVAAELEADLLEDDVGVVLDEAQALLAQHLERRQRPGQERDVLRIQRGPGRLAGGAPAGPARVVSSVIGVLRVCGRVAGVAGVPGRRRCRSIDRRCRRGGGVGRLPSRRWAGGRAALGRTTTRARCGLGAVRWGIASASTKCSWKRGSMAVSIFSTGGRRPRSRSATPSRAGR